MKETKQEAEKRETFKTLRDMFKGLGKKRSSEESFIDWCESMHLQNVNGRETEGELFRKGIQAAYDEKDIILLSFANFIQSDTINLDLDPETWVKGYLKHLEEPKQD